MAKVVSRDTIKRQTVRDMKVLGVYKKEYDRIIDIYADLVSQYNNMSAEFKDGGYQTNVSTGQGGDKKSPIVATLESLRKDILSYADRLCLTPAAKDKVKSDVPKKSALASALSNLE